MSPEQAYLAEIVEVGRRHGMVLAHEDGQGSFLVVERAALPAATVERYELWLLDAQPDES